MIKLERRILFILLSVFYLFTKFFIFVFPTKVPYLLSFPFSSSNVPEISTRPVDNFFLIHRANQRGAILLKNPYILGDTPILILFSIRDTNKSYTVSRREGFVRSRRGRRRRRRRMLLSMMKRIGADK